MNINGILNSRSYTYQGQAAKLASGSALFGDMLSAQRKQPAEDFTMRLSVQFPSSGAHIGKVTYEDDYGRTQSIFVEYAAESTPEEPVVRIYGRSFKGNYDCPVRIRDIDLENATHPELYALRAHESALKGLSMTPVGEEADADTLTLAKLEENVGVGDFSEKHNFLREYAENNGLYSVSIDIPITASETKTVKYYPGINPEDQMEQAEFERLMRKVDAAIEQMKEDAKQSAEEAEERKLQRADETKDFLQKQLLEQSAGIVSQGIIV